MSFSQKILQVSIVKGHGNFDSGGNTKIMSGLRVKCEIEKNGHPSKNKVSLKIYGMKQDDMNALTTLSFKPMAVVKNTIQVMAGDSNGMQVAFQGDITGAWEIYSSPPNLYFHVEALSGYYHSIAVVTPKGYPGSVSAASLMSGLASQMNLAFEMDPSNPVTTQLSRPYLWGTPFQQAAAIAAAANIEFGIDDDVLYIANRGKERKGTAPLVSVDTGLKAYPTFDKKGIRFKTLYNPAILYGGLVVVKSAIPMACGTWRVHKLRHDLESETPGGIWESEVYATPQGS